MGESAAEASTGNSRRSKSADPGGGRSGRCFGRERRRVQNAASGSGSDLGASSDSGVPSASAPPRACRTAPAPHPQANEARAAPPSAALRSAAPAKEQERFLVELLGEQVVRPRRCVCRDSPNPGMSSPSGDRALLGNSVTPAAANASSISLGTSPARSRAAKIAWPAIASVTRRHSTSLRGSAKS